jgi:hypothetical protein
MGLAGSFSIAMRTVAALGNTLIVAVAKCRPLELLLSAREEDALDGGSCFRTLKQLEQYAENTQGTMLHLVLAAADAQPEA